MGKRAGSPTSEAHYDPGILVDMSRQLGEVVGTVNQMNQRVNRIGEDVEEMKGSQHRMELDNVRAHGQTDSKLTELTERILDLENRTNLPPPAQRPSGSIWSEALPFVQKHWPSLVVVGGILTGAFASLLELLKRKGEGP